MCYLLPSFFNKERFLIVFINIGLHCWMHGVPMSNALGFFPLCRPWPWTILLIYIWIFFFTHFFFYPGSQIVSCPIYPLVLIRGHSVCLSKQPLFFMLIWCYKVCVGLERIIAEETGSEWGTKEVNHEICNICFDFNGVTDFNGVLPSPPPKKIICWGLNPQCVQTTMGSNSAGMG